MILNEAFKVKPEQRSIALTTLMREVEEFSFITEVDDSRELENVIDYQSPSVKKRAMTIATAFPIAVRILVALMTEKNPYEKFFINSVFQREAEEFKEARKILDDGSFDSLGNLLETTLENIKALGKLGRSSMSAETLAKVSSYAVTLAWFNDWQASGYFPRDLNIMRTNSETHIALTNEISTMLNSSYNNFLKHILVPGKDHKVELYPVIESKNADIIYYPSIVINNVLYDIKTTFDIQANLKKYVNYLIACRLILDEMHSGTTGNDKIDKLSLYFPRFNVIITLKETLDGYLEGVE
jgi:hypothetical protein